MLAGANGYLVQLNQGYLGVATQNDLKPYIHQFDWSFAFGAGLELPFGGSLSIRYSNGISDVNKYTLGTLPTNNQGTTITHSLSTAYARNQVLQISLAYKLEKLKIKLAK